MLLTACTPAGMDFCRWGGLACAEGGGAEGWGGDRKGRGNPRRFEHPLFRKTESLPEQLLRSHHKLKSRPPVRSVPFLATLASPKLQLVPGSPPVPALRSGASSAPCLPAWPLRPQPLRSSRAAGFSAAKPGLQLRGASALARVAASHTHSLHPPPLFLKGHQAKGEGKKSSRQVRLVSGHLLLRW